jgi:molybdenum cofactor synthesis domain-containing protein
MPRAAVITVSDACARGEREDVSGAEARRLLAEAGFELAPAVVVADERPDVAQAIREAAARAGLVVTTGGTGLAARDVTPEATLDVLDREAPGIAEHLRAKGLEETPLAPLSRGRGGARRGVPGREPARLAEGRQERDRGPAAAPAPRHRPARGAHGPRGRMRHPLVDAVSKRPI